jgi:polyphosphate kinase
MAKNKGKQKNKEAEPKEGKAKGKAKALDANAPDAGVVDAGVVDAGVVDASVIDVEGASDNGESPIEVVASKVDKDKPEKDPRYKKNGKLRADFYEQELARLQEELVKLQYWVKEQGLRVVILFEGRDAAGKGGVIKRMIECTNPRIVRVVALGVPTEREKTQWYFQRYVPHLPAGGEIVLFDRSWYNRAGVERVMGFCTEEEYWEFLRSCPQFERMLVRNGIILLKYWFSVSDEEQEKRFQERIQTPTKRWKLSPMDLESRRRWVDYSNAKDQMFAYTDIKQSPWYVVNADDKKKARLNCISHILSMIPYEDISPPPIELPPREDSKGYVRTPFEEQTFVPQTY